MGIEQFGADATQEQINKYGKSLISEYGVEVCEAAAVLDDVNVSDSTARSYKPQVRQVLAGCGDTNPTPRDALNQISDADKLSSTKSLMVSAVERYYKAIGEHSKGTELREMSNEEGVAEKNFNTETEISGWITREEVNVIEDKILPDKGQKLNRIEFADKAWAITAEHKALTMCLFYTACRVGEICRQSSNDKSICVEDIFPETNQMKLYRLKKSGEGYKRDMTAVPQKLIDSLTDYMDLYQIEEGELFPFTTRTAQNRIKDINNIYQHAFGEFSHMDKLTPHKFRHGRITDIANNSSLEDAGQYVDHASPETTNQYRHMATEEQREILPEESGGENLEIKELMEKLGVDSVSEAVAKVDELSED